MRKSTIIALFATVALPFSAYAQDSSSTPPADSTTPPAASDTASDPAAPAGGSGAATSAPAASSDSSGSMDAGSDASSSSMGADAEKPMDAASAGGSETFVTVPPTGAWRATDLEGKDVYDTQGESIGEITDVLVSEDGKVMAVLVGVGGFLGIGEKDVAVSMTALEFGPGKTEGLKTAEEVNAAAATATAPAGGTGMDGGSGGTAGSGAAPAPAASAAPPEPVVGEDNLPDRIVLNVSREDLEKAPAYGEPESESSESGEASTAPESGEASQPASDGSGSSN